ncbi:MAG: 4-(cytidine 5'-diphospho)-2-C-methyl-D-erythritol kinase [Candidatus Omnitrophica bacterium]|nr:4-(cytidine 5'-diphospho)-2-C-methyl-D-erythritol kinase [Candidatus Omnitrophota bacterium]
MHSLTLKSPAKINLYLKVLGRRRDGYHDLVTLFERISLKDSLRLIKAAPGVFSLSASEPALSVGEDNLITRAYRLLQRQYPKMGGVKVRLTKHIPIGGGLGGGSSNAAFFLLGMKRLYGLKGSENSLFRIGRRLGADVPFFLKEVPRAIGTGRGDRLRSIPSTKKLWLVLIISPYRLITKQVYGKFAQARPCASLTKELRTVKILCNFFQRKGLKQYALRLANDLEKPAFALRPELRNIKAKILQKGIQDVLMSGSGPTFFVLADAKRQAILIAKSLRRIFPSKKVLVCSSY